MYRDFYHLAKDPFGMAPDPSLLYLTAQHREALAGLLVTVLECKGLAVLTGEVGTGKTTLLRRVLRDIPGDRIPSSIIFNPTLTRDELLEMTMLGFSITDIPQSKPMRLQRLQRFLIECHESKRAPLLAIDEAHVLSHELLEEVRLLSNFELADRKLLQIVLIGQSELTGLLEKEELRQLKQRIAVRLSIKALSNTETLGYLRFRWAECGGSSDIPFTGPAVVAVTEWSQGIPRIINALCDNALMAAFGSGSAIVTAQHVEEAGADLRLQRPSKIPVPAPPPPPSPPIKVEEPETAHVPVADIPPVRLFGAYSEPPKKSLLWRWAARMGAFLF
jgi:general secretion pathway protein A